MDPLFVDTELFTAIDSSELPKPLLIFTRNPAVIMLLAVPNHG